MSRYFNPQGESIRFEMCSCGHFGGNSQGKQQHQPNFQYGHGGCTCEDCDCKQFTWVGFCNIKGEVA